MASKGSRVPRLEFGSGVRFRRRSSNITSGSIALEEDSRSSIDSTAGRGSYIDDNILSRADFTFKVCHNINNGTLSRDQPPSQSLSLGSIVR